MENGLKEIMSLLGEINKKFDAIDKRFDGMDKRFDGLETEVKGMRMEMETGFRNVYHRLDALDNTTTNLKYDMDLLYDKQGELERKINKVERIQEALFYEKSNSHKSQQEQPTK